MWYTIILRSNNILNQNKSLMLYLPHHFVTLTVRKTIAGGNGLPQWLLSMFDSICVMMNALYMLDNCG